MFRLEKTRSDRIFDAVNTVLLGLILIVVLYPLLYVAGASITDPQHIARGTFWLIPKDVTLEGYRRVFQNSDILRGYGNTLFYTFFGTFVNIALTIPAAYALSRKDLDGAGAISLLLAFTMFFSGGMIPTYLVVRDLHLLNTRWALILPSAVSVYNLIIARTFFQSNIPEELREATFLDGCSYTRFFFSIVLPLSKAIVAVLVLYYAVSHWNEYFSALLYLRKRELWPLQNFLREILIVQEISDAMMATEGELDSYGEQVRAAELIKYAVIIVSTLPILCLYPLLQKYFMKGVMIGAIKS